MRFAVVQMQPSVREEEEPQQARAERWFAKDEDAYLVAFRLNLKLEN
jgi:hypothetical protein